MSGARRGTGRAIGALVVAAQLWLAAPAAAKRLPPRPELANQRVGEEVVRVIDGDTMELASGYRVRLLHINTPETGELGADEAKALAQERCEGKVVTLAFGDTPQDHYGRLLAEVWVGDQSVNEALVEAGLAHAFFIPPVDEAATARIIAAQIEARKGRRGIWASDPRYQGAFHITSFKHNPPGDDRENLNGEYVRIGNVSGQPENLRGHRVENKRGDGILLGEVVVPVGRTIKIHVGSGPSNLDASKGQQRLHMGRDWPLWSNRGDLAILRAPDGGIVDQVPNKASRFARKKEKRW